MKKGLTKMNRPKMYGCRYYRSNVNGDKHKETFVDEVLCSDGQVLSGITDTTFCLPEPFLLLKLLAYQSIACIKREAACSLK